MDINYLLEREQVERVRARTAACDNARAAHFELASCYREIIEGHRTSPAKQAAQARRGQR